jgi:probable HAF family extracellular repeat protein
MKTPYKVSIAVALFATLLISAAKVSWAQWPTSTFKILNPPAASYSFAFGINNSGMVVGSYTDAHGTYRGFIYDGDEYRTIVFPEATSFTQANGVNDAGTIVGDFVGRDQLTHGFLLAVGRFARYDAKRGVSTWISGINKVGNLTGYVGNNGNTQGFVKIGRNVTFFTFHGYPTYVFSINASNTTVGYFIPPPFIASHGFIRAMSGAIRQLDYPGSLTTNCLGINDAGEVTGFYLDSRNVPHGFTYRNGRFHASSLPDIAGINNGGSYVGSFTSGGGKTTGYLSTPTAPDR